MVSSASKEVGTTQQKKAQERTIDAAAFKERARGIAFGALERLGEIATQPDYAPQHAIPAARAVIEYAFGRPATEKGDGTGPGLGMLDELLGAMDEGGR